MQDERVQNYLSNYSYNSTYKKVISEVNNITKKPEAKSYIRKSSSLSVDNKTIRTNAFKNLAEKDKSFMNVKQYKDKFIESSSKVNIKESKSENPLLITTSEFPKNRESNLKLPLILRSNNI